MEQGQKVSECLIERTRYAGRAVLEIEDVGLRHQRFPLRNVVAAGSLQPGRIPGVLDFPVGSRRHKATGHRLAVRIDDRLAVFDNFADCAHPICMHAAAGERPSAVDPKAVGHTVGHRLCRPAG